MKFLIKLFCLLSLLSSFGFSSDVVFFFSTEMANNYLKKSNVKFLANNKYVMFDRPDDPGHVYVGEIYSSDTYFYAGSLRGYFWNNQTGDVYYINNDVKTNYFLDRGYWGNFTRRYEYSGTYNSSAEFLTYVSIYEFHSRNIAVCNAGENFNTSTKQCVPACPAGQSWDVENNLCYFDCSDEDLNKFGYPNGTAQGGCVDCSNAFGDEEISSCVCAGFGSGSSEKGVYLNLEGNSFVSYNCADGSHIIFKRRLKENPDKDKEKEKENEKDKNENGNNDNTGKQDNNSPDNNSGGTAGNGSSGGGGSNLGSETKPNPNYKGEEGKEDGKGEEGKQEGKEDGKGKEGKGEDNVVAGRLDYGNLEKDMKDFKGDYGKAVEDSFSFVNDVKTSLSDTISKIKDGNLMSLKKSNIPSSCPLEYKVNLIYFEKDLIFDICKAISPASQTLYYFFYFVFFVLLFLAVIKLFILTFMGW